MKIYKDLYVCFVRQAIYFGMVLITFFPHILNQIFVSVISVDGAGVVLLKRREILLCVAVFQVFESI